MNMKVNIAGVEWKNPVTVASGTFGSGAEFADYVDLNRLGAVTTKGVANVPWTGNPTPRVAETYGGMMNAVGLQNPGIDLFCERDIPFLRKYDTKIIVNVCGKTVEDYCEVVERLRPQRRQAAEDFARRLEAELRELGFSEQVRVLPDFVPQEVWPGIEDDRVRILWAPNPGQAPQPLDKIASGGELSRFLLALVSVRPKAENATFIFDEVDAGVGGMTLNKLADKLARLAEQRQMLLITHWPQLAARAQRHFQVSKQVRGNSTFTLCTRLDAGERHAELARMAGGGAQGEAVAGSLEKERQAAE